MHTTAQLHHLIGRLSAFASSLISRAERIDVQRDFAHATATKFRKPAAELARRSRLLRQHAGDIFGRIDGINAELEWRAEQQSVLRSLSPEARAAVGELRLVTEPMIMGADQACRRSTPDHHRPMLVA